MTSDRHTADSAKIRKENPHSARRMTAVSSTVAHSTDSYQSEALSPHSHATTPDNQPIASDRIVEALAIVHDTPWRTQFLQTQATRELAALRWALFRGAESEACEWLRELHITRAADLASMPKGGGK
ncbi:MAG: hypothetical protein Q7S58_00100 [Candidatus Binatus sp.]|uniref:hypothetical protein n=1 Tax=Candidatus Binatus sp. TaxID=2811406 RepID=UPI002717898D|nr:hypothetical protein [Candidatus Binatus sp.]MDO8430786.1 hypothetical protein [Candidatus Binatus sp.]